MLTSCIDSRAATSKKRSLERNRRLRASSSRAKRRLALACREMSDRFLKAAACWRSAADRTPPTRSTSRWNSFIPVIVGKRALPALDLSVLFGPWLDAILRPEDIVMGFGPPEGDPEVQAALGRGRRARSHDVRAAGRARFLRLPDLATRSVSFTRR